MTTAGQILFAPVFACPDCGAEWSYGYGQGEPKGKARCPRCERAYLIGMGDGYEAAVRDFWRGVCARMADEIVPRVAARQKAAARWSRATRVDFCQWDDPILAGVFARNQAVCAAAYADARELFEEFERLRAWAREGV